MEDCCKTESRGEAPSPKKCPSCGEMGRKVQRITLESLVTPERQWCIGEHDWLFCVTSDCVVVYFAADGSSRFNEDDLKVKVHQKHPQDPSVLVCYCFQHSPDSITWELKTTGDSTVLESIKRDMQGEGCNCEQTNPQGGCCLGNVQKVLKSAKFSLDQELVKGP